MEQKDTKELWGVEFRTVPDGLDEDQVVSFVDKLMEQSRLGRDEQERQASLHKLAEQTVVEADKLAESIKEDARKEAQEEAARIQAAAEEQAQAEADRIIKQAERDSAARSRAALAKSDKDAQEAVAKSRKEAQSIVQDARDRAEAMETEAKLEAEYIVRRLTVKFVEEVRSVVTETSNNLLPSIDAQISELSEIEALGEGNDSQPTIVPARRKRKS